MIGRTLSPAPEVRKAPAALNENFIKRTQQRSYRMPSSFSNFVNGSHFTHTSLQARRFCLCPVPCARVAPPSTIRPPVGMAHGRSRHNTKI
jgi:hypothetical protein